VGFFRTSATKTTGALMAFELLRVFVPLWLFFRSSATKTTGALMAFSSSSLRSLPANGIPIVSANSLS
jgi:hypothetical protein